MFAPEASGPASDTPPAPPSISRISRKRKIDECSSTETAPCKRIATAPIVDDDDVVVLGSSPTEQEPDDDYIHRPRPDQDYGDHRWRASVVSKLIAGSTDVLSLFPKGRSRCSRIHKELLCYYSTYYRNLLSSHFDDAKNKRSFWADTTQRALALFVKWLYTRDLTDARGDYNWHDLAELYIFAHLSLVLALKRDIMDVLHHDHWEREGHWFFAYSVIAKVYRCLPSESPLRAFIVSTHIQHWSPDVDDAEVKRERAAQAPPEFLFAVMEGQAYVIRDGDTTLVNTRSIDVGPEREAWCCGELCLFHEHEDDEERAATCGLACKRSVEHSCKRTHKKSKDTHNDYDDEQSSEDDG